MKHIRKSLGALDGIYPVMGTILLQKSPLLIGVGSNKKNTPLGD